MKIFYLTTHLNGTDGWSRYSANLIEGAVKRGNEVGVAVFEKDDSNLAGLAYRLPVLKDPFKYILNFFRCWETARIINRELKNNQPDVVHCLVEPYLGIVPFLSIPKNTKFFLTIHGTFSYMPNLFSDFLRKKVAEFILFFSIKKINRIVSVSEFTKNYFLENIRIEKKPLILVINNGIRIPLVKKYDKVLPPRILFVGAVKRRKGLKETIEVLKIYKDKYKKDFKFTIVGGFSKDDKYYQELIELIGAYSLQNDVEFTGRVDEETLAHYYGDSSLFILLPQKAGNRFEGFGLVFLEASARGLPVIGLSGSGASEAINSGKSGLIGNQSDWEGVADLIDTILNKGVIKSDDCINWAKKNDVELRIDDLMKLYKFNE